MSRARERLAATRRGADTLPSPNIWHWPEVYEVENRAQDVDGEIWRVLASVADWAGRDVLDIGCGSGFHLPRFAATARRVIGVEPHEPLVRLARERIAALAGEAGRDLGRGLRPPVSILPAGSDSSGGVRPVDPRDGAPDPRPLPDLRAGSLGRDAMPEARFRDRGALSDPSAESGASGERGLPAGAPEVGRVSGEGGPSAGPPERRGGLGAVEVISGSAQRLPLPDASVDLAHARTAYFFGPGCEPGLAEVERVLRPGGWFVLVDLDVTHSPYGDWMRADLPSYDPTEVDEFFARSGFDCRRITTRWLFADRDSLESVLRIEFSRRVADRAIAEVTGLSMPVGYRVLSRRKPTGLLVP